MTLSEFNMFNITIYDLNLFSFMLGMTFAFFNQGIFGRNIGQYVFGYFAGLAAWYALLYYMATNNVSFVK